MDASDLLDSDQRIMAATSVRDGILSFNFGDGQPPLRGTLDGVLNSKQIIQWCNAVRSTYRARQDSKENQKDSPAAVVRSSPVGEDAPAAVSSRGGLPVETSVEGVKASLAAGIESSLVEVGRQREAVEREIESCRARLEELRGKMEQLLATSDFYVRMKETICGT